MQLYVLDDPERDDRGWVLSVAHLDVVGWPRLEALLSPEVRVAPVAKLQWLAIDTTGSWSGCGRRTRRCPIRVGCWRSASLCWIYSGSTKR